ncbi:hypothetical protein [Meinhardsimonia xiamenensis]|nr:hypothetical protein [Meinhardsimonia xiamenensis]
MAAAGIGLALAASGPGPAHAEAPQAAAAASDSARQIALELNTIDQTDEACRITFVIRNALGSDLEGAVFEAVLFDSGGRVERLTLLDFGALPAERMQVRQFALPGLDCARLGAVLINGAESCAGKGVGAGDCMAALWPTSRVQGVEMLK